MKMRLFVNIVSMKDQSYEPFQHTQVVLSERESGMVMEHIIFYVITHCNIWRIPQIITLG